ncbi:hypothetical protein FRC08_004020 [Ceratobasidium sp. 394]|nr:hypothetical protein FRC08_004020 [Ceratobasidium sp. 394]
MPTLARPSFPAGFPPPRDDSGSPYQNLPWTNAYFCQQVGLAKVGEGLEGGFTEEMWNKMSPTQRGFFDEEGLKSARHWLTEIQKRHREDPKTYMIGMTHIPGSKEFTRAMKVLIDLRVGVIVWDTMVLMKATPADALRDARFNAHEEDTPFDENDPNSIPASDTYYGHASAHLARALFGEDAINRSSQSVKDKYSVPLRALFSRTWDVKRVVLKNAIESRARLPGEYSKALQGEMSMSEWILPAVLIQTAEATSQPTPKKLMAANKALSKWREVADLTGERDAESFAEQEALLKQLWESLGRSRDKNGAVRRVKATRQALCSQTELDAAYEHYVELHFPPAGAIEMLLESPGAGDPQAGQLLLDDIDTNQAVRGLSTLKPPELVRLAGLPEGSTSFPMAERGTKAGEGKDGEVTEKPAIVPDWHQWVGALAMTRAWFTTGLGESPRPLLLCDEVGLGKTLQMVMTVCFMVHLIEMQARQLELPPLLRAEGREFFAGRKDIPSLPILVLVPIAVSSQWRDEIIRYTEHGSFQVLIYSRNRQSRQEFFKPGGIWDRAVVQSKSPHRTILIAEFNTVAKEAEECLRRPTRDKVAVRSAQPHQLIDHPGPTIFTLLFLIGIIDEIHGLRNINFLWEAVLALMNNCCVRQAATATPIWTGYNDVLSALRLIRHPSVIGEQGIALGERLDQLEKDAGVMWKDPLIVRQFAQVMAKRQLQVEGRDVSESSIAEIVEITLNVQKKNLRSFFVSYPCISHLKVLLGSSIIRRGLRDLDPEGQPVLKLDPYVESVVYVVLNDVERKAIDAIASKKPTSVSGKAGELAWVNFLIDYRFAVFHWLLLNRKDISLDWARWTMNDFSEMASSKLRALIRIIQYYRQDPNSPPLFFRREDGQAILPEQSSAANNDDQSQAVANLKPRKFIVFVMYHIPRQIIKKVLELHDISFREFDGTMALKARNKALKEFLDDDSILVLLMSNVGTVGLNIICASIVIIVDQPWSYSELLQILGRAWRKGQLRIVHFYRLIARDTADEIMSGYANGKSLMQDHLIYAENLLDSIHGRDEESLAIEDKIAEEAEIEAPRPVKRGKGSYVKARPAKVKSSAPAKLGSDSSNAKAQSGTAEVPCLSNQPSSAVGSSTEDAGPTLPVPAQPAPAEASSSSVAEKGKGKTTQLIEPVAAAEPPFAPADVTSQEDTVASPLDPTPSHPATTATTDVPTNSQGHKTAEMKALLSKLDLSKTDLDVEMLVNLANEGFTVSDTATPAFPHSTETSAPSPRLQLTDLVRPEVLDERTTGVSSNAEKDPEPECNDWPAESNWGTESRSPSPPLSNYSFSLATEDPSQPAPGASRVISRMRSKPSQAGIKPKAKRPTVRGSVTPAQSSQSAKRRASSPLDQPGSVRPRAAIVDDDAVFSNNVNQMDLLRNRKFSRQYRSGL